MIHLKLATFLTICFFLFCPDKSLSQTENEMIRDNALFHIVTNEFNPLNVEELDRRINSVYNGLFYVWNSQEYAARADSFKSENEFVLTFRVYDAENDSTNILGESSQCLLENKKRNLNLNWNFEGLVEENDVMILFEGFEIVRANKEANFDSMFPEENKPLISAISVKLAKNGRFVKNLKDAIEASLTIDVDDGHGSGFFISDSIVVTNYHVVKDQENITSKSTAGKINFEVITKDSLLDLAILKSDVISDVYFSLLENPLIDIGSDILIIGSPTSKLLTNSLSSGIISGIRDFEDMTIIQTDAKINPGNSGGALLDSNGNLHGVVTAKVFGYGIEGLGFAIPTKYIIQILN